MKVLVRFFARLREEFGTGEKVLKLRDGATLAELLDLVLKDRRPKDLIIAVNNELIGDRPVEDLRLEDGDTVDIMPPASGG